MKSKKVLVHASQALCVAIVLSFIVVGCNKRRAEKPLPEVYVAEGHAYMRDPEFKKILDVQAAEKTSILREREKLFAEFAKLEKEAGSRAAAEKMPRWKALCLRAESCARAFESNRWHSADILRERVKRAQEDSERVRRGEARAKEISK